MKLQYLIVVGIVFALLAVPLYQERHVYEKMFFNHPRICYGISYTGAPAFSQCAAAETRDCFTTTSGGTSCTQGDITDVIAFGGVSLVLGSLMILASMATAYPFARRLNWV